MKEPGEALAPTTESVGALTTSGLAADGKRPPAPEGISAGKAARRWIGARAPAHRSSAPSPGSLPRPHTLRRPGHDEAAPSRRRGARPARAIAAPRLGAGLTSANGPPASSTARSESHRQREKLAGRGVCASAMARRSAASPRWRSDSCDHLGNALSSGPWRAARTDPTTAACPLDRVTSAASARAGVVGSTARAKRAPRGVSRPETAAACA